MGLKGIDRMTLNPPMTRRASLKRLLHITGGLALSPFGKLLLPGPDIALAQGPAKAFLVEGLAERPGYAVKELIQKVFDAAGGLSRFIGRGDVVVIKPNLSWARHPGLAATTNPEVLKGVIELCYEAGAKKVRVADNTINDATRCFAVTGANQVIKETGAELIFPRESLMKEMKINGDRLNVWPVFVPMVEADKIINLPIAKHHSLCSLTLGMKNWIGAVGGARYALHQDIHQTVVDLARFFKPTVTLIDAINIMTRNGPSGGSSLDVAPKNTLILSNDQVAADAYACRMFGYHPDKIGFIHLGQKWGLGTYDFERLVPTKVTL